MSGCRNASTGSGREGVGPTGRSPTGAVAVPNGRQPAWRGIVAALVAASGGQAAFAHECGQVPVCVPAVASSGGSFGNVGFAAAASMCSSRTIWTGVQCGQPVSLCPPTWCAPCLPCGGWSFGWPGWGIGSWSGYGIGGSHRYTIGGWPRWGIGGWHGNWRSSGTQTIVIGGPGTFITGNAVPWWWGGNCAVPCVPLAAHPRMLGISCGVGPATAGVPLFQVAAAQFAGGHRMPPRAGFGQPAGPGAGMQPAGPGAGSANQRPGVLRRLTATGVTQPGNETRRRRAADLVAAGDRHLRGSAGGEPALRAALAAYRRAAAADRDCPDTFIRQALVHAALGDRAACDAAIAEAVALDGRLSAAPVAAAADPVFGAAGGDSSLPARGDRLIAEIAAPARDGDAPAADLRWLSARWAGRGTGGLDRLAAARP